MCLDHIPFPNSLPPTLLSSQSSSLQFHVLLLINFDNPLSPLSAAHIFVVVELPTGACGNYQWPSLNSDSPSFHSHHGQQLGVETQEPPSNPLHAGVFDWIDLGHDLACNHSCCELTCTKAVSCPCDSISQYSSPSSGSCVPQPVLGTQLDVRSTADDLQWLILSILNIMGVCINHYPLQG